MSLNVDSLAVQSFATEVGPSDDECVCFAPPCICTAASDCVTNA